MTSLSFVKTAPQNNSFKSVSSFSPIPTSELAPPQPVLPPLVWRPSDSVLQVGRGFRGCYFHQIRYWNLLSEALQRISRPAAH